jgi:hypothetical protein
MFDFLTRIMAACAIVIAVMGQCDVARAAGAVLHQDCVLAWDANPELDLAGYRVYLGRFPGLLTQNSDVGNVTQVSCSHVGATTNGQWFVAVTAHDTSGNESARSLLGAFELTGLPSPMPLQQVSEPAVVQLTVREPGFQLAWADSNLYQASHRIEIASSLNPNWTTLTVLPPGATRLSYFLPVDVEWVCYRVRAERGAVASLWAQAGGPNDRQFCFSPTRATSIDQPIPLPALILEPQLVQLAAMRPGFQLIWENWNGFPVQHKIISRIEVSSSINPKWTTLSVLKEGELNFGFLQPIDAEWVCFRIRHEIGRFVSLWTAAGSLNDRQFCYSPLS